MKNSSAKHKKKSVQTSRSYTPLCDALSNPRTFVDTELAQGISRYSLVGLLRGAMSRKRRKDGEPLNNVLCALLVWPLLKASSMHSFCAELCQFLEGKISVLYDFLGRDDINWRGLLSELSQGVYPNFADSTLRECFFHSQVIEKQGRLRSKSAQSGCSGDLPYSQAICSVHNLMPSCFCDVTIDTKTARTTGSGRLSRTSAAPMAKSCNVRCFILARSTTNKRLRGKRASRF